MFLSSIDCILICWLLHSASYCKYNVISCQICLSVMNVNLKILQTKSTFWPTGSPCISIIMEPMALISMWIFQSPCSRNDADRSSEVNTKAISHWVKENVALVSKSWCQKYLLCSYKRYCVYVREYPGSVLSIFKHCFAAGPDKDWGWKATQWSPSPVPGCLWLFFS